MSNSACFVCWRRSPPSGFIDQRFMRPLRSLVKTTRSRHASGLRLVPSKSAVSGLASRVSASGIGSVKLHSCCAVPPL